jgi:hypothetical protein
VGDDGAAGHLSVEVENAAPARSAEILWRPA